MKRFPHTLTILIGAGILMLLAESCAPKIQGARPHRRDRHCGCEVPTATQTDTTCYITQK